MAYVRDFTHSEIDMGNMKKILDKWGLTVPQMYVLWKAVWPWDTSYSHNPKLHDGTVSEYGVMEKTLAALRAGGFIGKELEYPEEKRVEMLVPLQHRDNRVTRITLKGRQAVAEFLEALGIKEE